MKPGWPRGLDGTTTDKRQQTDIETFRLIWPTGRFIEKGSQKHLGKVSIPLSGNAHIEAVFFCDSFSDCLTEFPTIGLTTDCTTEWLNICNQAGLLTIDPAI